MKRDQIVSVVCKAEEDPESFLELIERHRDGNDPFVIAEFLQSLPKRQHAVIWTSLLSLTNNCASDGGKGVESGDNAPPTLSEQPLQLSEASISLVVGVVEFCAGALSLEDYVTPDPMAETLQVLHDILLSALEVTPDLQNRVCGLLELWWCGDKPNKEGLVPHCILYLVARTLTEGAKVSDVKRVWSMRNAFLLLDFEDPMTTPFKMMLLACILQKLYLQSDEGRKFLSFLFGMHPKFVEDLHQTIKNQIPLSPKPVLEIYAEVYFRAWRLSSGPYLQQIEEHCLQDLMFSAVHTPRTGPNGLFHALRKVLGHIHQQQAQKGVCEMLLRLYSPFLWRSLKVAHPHVRANAASLFLDAFPLQDPTTTKDKIDIIMQKQFDVMKDLLGDPSVLVRGTAVSGGCRILSLYFEMIPFPVIKALIGRLIRELAWDAASIDVRVTVLQGLCVILKNRLSHTLLKELLPLLRPLLHDKSEKVRLAFLELLLVVKGMRTLKFWHICPLEHVLARLEVDSVHVVKRIVSLLMDALKPASSQRIQRCITLVRLNPGAARRFYQLAGVNLSPGDVVRFILAVQTSLLQCIRDEGRNEETPEASDSEDDSEATSEIGSGGGWHKENIVPDTHLSKTLQDQSECADPLSLSDSELVCGLLEVMAVMWEVVKDRLDKQVHRKLKNKLTSNMVENLPLLFNAFTDGPPRSALYLLASHLPPRSIQSIVNGSFQTLASLQTLTSKTHDHTCLLMALVLWQRTGDVIELAHRWISPYLDLVSGEGEETTGSEKPSRKRTKRGKNKGGASKSASGEAPPPSDPLLKATMALSMLSWMMCHPLCMEEVKKVEEFWGLSGLLKHSMTIFEEQYFSSSPKSNSKHRSVPFDLLRTALSLHIRICLHKGAEIVGGASDEGKEEEEAWFIEEMMEVLRWCEKVLVPALTRNTNFSAASKTRQSSRKRKTAHSHPPPVPPPAPPAASLLLVTTQAEDITGDVLSLLSEMFLVGVVVDSALEKEIAHVASTLANTGSGFSLLPSLSKLLYQFCEISHHQEVEGISGGPGALSPIATLLVALLSLLHRVSLENETAFTKAWLTFRQCLNGAIMASLRITSLSITPHPLETYSILTQTLIQAQVNHIQTNPSSEPPSTLDDLPTFVRCILNQACKDKQSTHLFGSHLYNYLTDVVESSDSSHVLLVHHASLHFIHVLSRGKYRGEELMRCVRYSTKMVERISEVESQSWSGPVSELKILIETIQDRIYK